MKLSDYYYGEPSHSENTYVKKMTEQLNIQQNEILMTQLNSLISQGLLEVIATQPMLVSSYDPLTGKHYVELKQAIGLKLRDQEVIDKLNEKNEKLTARIKELENVLKTIKEIV